MQYLTYLNAISVGQVVLGVLIGGFLGKGLLSFLEKYRKTRNKQEDKIETIDNHDQEIASLQELYGTLNEKIDTCITGLQALTKEANGREARRLRREILKFADSLRDGRTPSKDSFEDIIDCNEEYEELIEKEGIKNGYTAREMKFVYAKFDALYGVVDE